MISFGVMIWYGLGFLVSLLWAFLLYKMANVRSGSNVPFFTAFLIPKVVVAIALLFVVAINPLLLLGGLLLYFVWTILLGMALYDSASSGETTWFVFIIMFPVLWIVYQLTR